MVFSNKLATFFVIFRSISLEFWRLNMRFQEAEPNQFIIFQTVSALRLSSKGIRFRNSTCLYILHFSENRQKEILCSTILTLVQINVSNLEILLFSDFPTCSSFSSREKKQLHVYQVRRYFIQILKRWNHLNKTTNSHILYNALQ